MVDYLAFFDDQHGNSTMGPPVRFWHGATRGLNPALVQCFLQGHSHRLLGVAGLGPWTTPHPIVYVADLAEIVAEHSTSFHAYADDNQLYIHCQPKGAQTAVLSVHQ